MQQRLVKITLMSPGDSRAEKERLHTLFQLAIAIGKRKGLLRDENPAEGDGVVKCTESCVDVENSVEAPASR